MKMKFVCASILVMSSAAVFGQTANRDKSTPLLYQCLVTPQTLDSAINTDGTGTSAGRTATGAITTTWDRIDLEFAMTRPSRRQTVPTISGHAINTKGTAVNPGRMSGRPDSVASVSCANGVSSSGEGVQKVSMREIDTIPSLIRRTLPSEISEFSCSVSGTIKRPQFSVGIWSLGIGDSYALYGPQRRKPRKGESLTDWMASVHNTRVSIVPHNMAPDAPQPRVPCSSETPAMQMKYDLAMLR